MANETTRPLKVFLCHASGDKTPVRELYKRLVTEGVDAWLDQEKLLPGQNWRVEIPRAVREADVVVICLSNKSITKEGYIQKEIKFALDSAEEKPEGTIFLIPARLEECAVPEQLGHWQWVDLFDESGFVRLLRSLKLRANRVGATVEPLGYESEDKETERRLNQLYTDGLAAFYTEDWDRAYQRFQTILSERPNHKPASEKLAEAERQRNLAKLYAQAEEAHKTQNWQAAIRWLEELVQKSADYKDSAQLLKDARKQRQLKELYAEAGTLHAAQKWQAVLKVFQQIAGIEPAFPDPEGLLPSAEKEVAELKRLADLNALYSQAVHKMDSGEWYEARSLLEQVHQAQTDFLETERLLKKAENEILRIEERRKRDAQVQMLYEQARKLTRAGQWGKALTQMEEIQKLDNQFVDSDGILEKVKAELEREELEAQQRRELASLYAEAVRLLEAKKYQEALEKWNAIQVVDPKYKDVSRVKSIARRKLDELARPEMVGRPWPKILSDWVRLEANIPADREIPSEKLLLFSFAAIAVIHELSVRVQTWLNVWEWQSVNVHLLGFVIGALQGGLYGIVVAFALDKTIYNWQRKHSLTVIMGWALAIGLQWLIRGVFDTSGFFDSNLLSILFLFSGLAIVAAIKWSKPATSPINMVLILVGWALAWWAGETLGGYLSAIHNNGGYFGVGNAFVILLGLLFTFGMQVEKSWEVLKTAFFGALGFAVGNYIVDIIGFAVSLPVPIAYAMWGLIGGAILQAPSRDIRRILFSAGICGAGLLAGYYIFLIVSFALGGQSYLEAFPDRYHILRNIILGIGLGLTLGLLIRRASASGMLVVLGVGIFMITRALNADTFTFPDIWKAIVRGALIGLVLGYGYGYVGGAKSLEGKPNFVRAKPIWMGIIGVVTVGIIVAMFVPDTYVNTPRVDALASSSIDLNVWAPQNAIDGDVGTAWSSNGHEKPINTEWFAVDMGTPQKIVRILVYPRDRGWCFPGDFKFQTSNDGTNWRDIPGQSYIDYPNPGSTEQVFNFTAVTARYIRMYATRLRPDDYRNYYFQLEDIYPQGTSR